jgi:hypothetical protein
MPRKDEYPEKLTHLEIIKLFEDGKYKVDPNKGTVISGRTGKPLFWYVGGWKAGRGAPDHETASRWVRLFSVPKARAIQISHCVWLYMARVPIPDGFQIHHRDTDQTNNCWKNLFCLFHKDHTKLHNGNGEVDDLIEEEISF